MDVIGLDYGGLCSVCWIRYRGGLEHSQVSGVIQGRAHSAAQSWVSSI